LSRCTNSTVLARPKSLLIHDVVFAYSSVGGGCGKTAIGH
jgi:hypothetical protein